LINEENAVVDILCGVHWCETARVGWYLGVGQWGVTEVCRVTRSATLRHDVSFLRW